MPILTLLLAASGCLAQDAAAPATPEIAPVVTASPVAPPDWSVRRKVFFKHLVGPQAILETVPGAIFDTVRKYPDGWGRNVNGVSKRLASQYGQFLVGESIEATVSAFHKEDPRYFRVPDASVGRRIAHAFAGTVVVRKADGSGNTIALARLADVYGSTAIATLWSPADTRTARSILGNASLGLIVKTSSNLFREFWPDAKRLMKRH